MLNSFCGAGVKIGLCSAVEEQITSNVKMEQLKTPDYKVLYSHCLLVSKAVKVWSF